MQDVLRAIELQFRLVWLTRQRSDLGRLTRKVEESSNCKGEIEIRSGDVLGFERCVVHQLQGGLRLNRPGRFSARGGCLEYEIAFLKYFGSPLIYKPHLEYRLIFKPIFLQISFFVLLPQPLGFIPTFRHLNFARVHI
jgi:hypothetical protein